MITRHQLAGPLLEACSKRVEEDALALKATIKHIALTLDGSTDVNGASVTVFMTHYPDGSTLCEDVAHAKQESHDAQWVKDQVNGQIELKAPGQRFCGTCMDNTATNQLANEGLRLEHPGCFFHGCVCHALQLAFQDTCRLVPGLSDTIEVVKNMIFFIYRHQKVLSEARALAKEAKKSFLIKPCATRMGCHMQEYQVGRQ